MSASTLMFRSMMMIFIIIQLGIAIYIRIGENDPSLIGSEYAPVQIIFLIVAIIFLTCVVLFFNDNKILSLMIVIISLVITCTTIFYLRHLDKDYVTMNQMRHSSTPQSTTTFITNAMQSTFQHEKQLKNDIINTNANRYGVLQQNNGI